MGTLAAKFLVVPDKRPKRAVCRVIEDLRRAGYRIGRPGEERIRDCYFDSEDRHLYYARWTYWVRESNDELTANLMQLTCSRQAVFDRHLIEQPLGTRVELDRPQSGPVAQRLDELFGRRRAPWYELFALDNLRTRYQLTKPEFPGAIVELAFDRVRVETADALRFTELKFELKQGRQDILIDLISVLRRQRSLIPARIGKFQRGLFATEHQPQVRKRDEPAIDRESRWVDVGHQYLTRHLNVLKGYEPFAWEGLHPEGVHQMRVATRRVRATLEIFEPVLPNAVVAKLRKDVRALGLALGQVRDLDVQVARLNDYQRRLCFEDGQLLGGYRRYLQRRWRRSNRRLIKFLGGPRYDNLLSDFGQVLDRDESSTEIQRRLSVERAAGDYVKPQLQKVLEQGAAITRRSPPEALHSLRIEIKQLRYQMEHLRAAYGRPIKRVSKSLGGLQDILGSYQDCSVARHQLNAYRRGGDQRRSETKVFKRLFGFEREDAARWRKRFHKSWGGFAADAKRAEEVLG